MDEKSNNISKDGVLIVTLSSWHEFYKEVSNLKSKRGYVWRGQKKDEDNGWVLNSKFDRDVKSKAERGRVQKLECHLNNFKEAMNRYYPGVLPKYDVDIWALGQHYGLKTPLLDWTLSPDIAAYFAFIECEDTSDPNDSYRYVYALNRSVERLLSKQKKADVILSKERSVLFIDKLSHPSPRFTVQKGIFSKAFHGKGIGKYVQIFSDKRPDQIFIVKFRIPTKDRVECLRELRSKNIDHVNLLLDLRNVVDPCNNKL